MCWQLSCSPSSIGAQWLPPCGGPPPTLCIAVVCWSGTENDMSLILYLCINYRNKALQASTWLQPFLSQLCSNEILNIISTSDCRTSRQNADTREDHLHLCNLQSNMKNQSQGSQNKQTKCRQRRWLACPPTFVHQFKYLKICASITTTWL